MKYSIKVPCLKDNLSKIRSFVSEVLNNYELTDVQINNLVLAVDEVCANLIIHSYNCRPDEEIELHIDVDNPNKIIFDIHDHSPGFDIRLHQEPQIEEIIKSKRKGGVGLLLVKKIMDEIDFISGTDYNIVRLTKFIS
jgi:serine/threonine-protein kinase RsbW